MKTLVPSLIIAMALFISACNSNSTSEKNKSADSTSVHTAGTTYTFPMHPEVVNDKPGKCPECKMALVAKEEKDHSDHQH